MSCVVDTYAMYGGGWEAIGIAFTSLVVHVNSFIDPRDRMGPGEFIFWATFWPFFFLIVLFKVFTWAFKLYLRRIQNMAWFEDFGKYAKTELKEIESDLRPIDPNE